MRKKTLHSANENKIDKVVPVKKSEKKTKLSGVPAVTPLPKLPVVLPSSSEPAKTCNTSVALVPVLQTLVLYKNVPSEKSFILCDGKSIHNCKELADILVTVSDDIFGYHVTDTKNDFANWINDVFEDHDLAKKISLLKNRIDMGIEIYRHMFELLEKLSQTK